MTRKLCWLVIAVVLLSVFLRGNNSPQPPLIAIDPWVDIEVPVVATDVVVVGFLVKNRSAEQIELLEGSFEATSNDITLKAVWVSDTIGCLSGPFDSLSERWNGGVAPSHMHGYLLNSSQTIGIAYVFSVQQEGNHSITNLGVTYRSELSSRTRKWFVNDFVKLSLNTKVLHSTSIAVMDRYVSLPSSGETSMCRCRRSGIRTAGGPQVLV